MKHSTRLKSGASCAAVIAAAFSFAPAAFAQAQAQGQADSSTITEVVVTASRIQRDGFQTPTPTTVMGAEELQKLAPVHVADAVNQLPQVWGSTVPQGVNLNFGPNLGGNFINLRGLGINRTLVMLNGRRVPPQTATANIDVNLIPSQLISRVDVVTGGASASWGSDAVSGVVNFVLDQKFSGFEAKIEGGRTDRGDGNHGKFEFAFGSDFAGGRGHVVASAMIAEVDEIRPLNSRSWYNSNKLVRNPAWVAGNGQPYYLLAKHVGAANLSLGGLITGVSGGAPSTLVGTNFGAGGATSRFDFGQIIPGGTLMLGGTFVEVAGYNPIQPSDDQAQAFVHANYDISDNVTAFVEGSYGRSVTENLAGTGPQGTGAPFGAITILQGNPFVPAAIAAQMPAGSSLTMGRLNLGAYRQNPKTEREATRFVAGFTAKLPKDWTLDAYAQYGKSTIDFHVYGNPIPVRMREAIDAVLAPAGNAAGVPAGTIVCRSTLTNPSNGCVPFNPFGIDAPSAASVAYSTGTGNQVLELEEKIASGQLSGTPFATWAGDVSLVVGAETRKESIVGTADPLSIANSFVIGNFKPIRGSYSVTEAFAETAVPLLRKAPLADLVELNAAVRRTHYSTSGNVTTWKLGLNWTVNDQLRFRATRSRDIRAPNLNELFASQQTSTTSIAGFGSVPLLNKGNIALRPEVSDQWGVGAVYRPSWLPGLGLSIDYYDIKLADAIATPQATQVVNFCQQGVAFFCALGNFNAAGAPTQITIQPVNAAAETERGIDYEISYRTDLDGLGLPGKVNLRALLTNTRERTVTFGGVKTVLLGNVGATFGASSGIPRWRGRYEASYELGPSTTSLAATYISAGVIDPTFKEGGNAALLSIDENKVAKNIVFTLSQTVDLKSVIGRDLRAFAVVENLFDKHPPVVGTLGDSLFTTGTSALYDIIGRRYRVGIRYRF